jgi:anti-sigma factor RsiW
MRPVRDIDLMQLADGELDAAERAELEALIARDPDAEKKVQAIGEVGEVVRGHLELAADDAEPRLANMWAEIEKRIELEGSAARATPAAAPVRRPTAAQPVPGLWGSVTRWIDTYRGHVLTGALSAGAVAAVALYLSPAPRVADRAPVQQATAPAPTVTPEPEVQAAHLPAEVESMDVTDGTSAVFTYEGEDGEQTTVIWVTPDDITEGL